MTADERRNTHSMPRAFPLADVWLPPVVLAWCLKPAAVGDAGCGREQTSTYLLGVSLLYRQV